MENQVRFDLMTDSGIVHNDMNNRLIFNFVLLERLLFLALKSLKNLSDLFLPDSVGSVGSCVLGGIFGTVCASRIFKTPGGCVVIEKIAIVFSENPKRDIVTKSG